MDILTKSVFDFPYASFSPDFIILFENLGAGRQTCEEIFGNLLCVCGC